MRNIILRIYGTRNIKISFKLASHDCDMSTDEAGLSTGLRMITQPVG